MAANALKTEQTPNGLATYISTDFRTYAPEVTVRNGVRVVYQLCESLEGGRWEGYVSIKTPKALREAFHDSIEDTGVSDGVTLSAPHQKCPKAIISAARRDRAALPQNRPI